MKSKLIPRLITCMQIASICPAVAQVGTTDPDAAQVVGLFQQSCMRFAGDSAGLRAWISGHHLPQVPGAQAQLFLGPALAGQVYGASNAAGKHVLVSYDSGACQVIAMAADPAQVQQMLLALLRQQGVSVSPAQVRSKPDGSATQTLFDAALGARHWQISITSKRHTDAPNMAAELHLLVTAG
jgi:hypothetical protein